jgi:hypothetical protein
MLDPKIGERIFGETIQTVEWRLVDSINTAAEGQFQPNREKDELTYALDTPKHPGRTRDKGVILWKASFPEDTDTYRSRQRRKDEEVEWIHRIELMVLEGWQ